MRLILGLMTIAMATIACGTARAEVKLSGSFVADRACAAVQSIKSDRNPGDVAVESGKSYELLAGNKTEPSHYLIAIPGAEPERRWVSVNCGHRAAAEAERSKPSGSGGPSGKATAQGKPEFVLALSWQPAFCETRPGKRECRAQRQDGFDASHFTLHGLWPQPNGNFYCEVVGSDQARDRSGRWKDLPPVRLDGKTRRELERVMPGTQSHLDRHEWIKHGTCSGLDQQQYFATALTLARAVNTSPVRELFASNVGRALSAGQIRRAFDKAFGKGAGERVRVSCVTDPSNGRRMISEITLGIAGAPGGTLSERMLAAPRTDDAGCPAGIVDPVGLQ
jgi:ribonuclease T2